MPQQAVVHSITPRLPSALPKQARKLVKAAIESHLAAVEALTEFLDETDGDPDEEPSLGSLTSSCTPEDQRFWALGGMRDDREDEHDGSEPDDDTEPSLAHTNDFDQSRAARAQCGWSGMYVDAEQEHDGREPSLGAANPRPPAVEADAAVWARSSGLDQTNWAEGDRRDLEGDEHDGREPEDEI